MKQYQAYLFDWDGTLCQTLQVWLDILRSHYNKYDLHPTDAQIAALFGDWRAAEKLGLDAKSTDTFIAELEEISHAAIQKAPLYPQARETLQALQADGSKKLALVTSSIRKTIDTVLEHHNILEYFQSVVTGDDVTSHKPDPESLRFAAQQLGVDISDCVMIGDSDKDMLAAKNAGCDSILFYPPQHHLFHDKEYLTGLQPTHVITQLSQILS
jgi:HAD superfamily hydrolase (TIGR01509 family)